MDEEQERIVRQAIDNGITLLDTAYIYGPERSEELVGQVVRISTRESARVRMLLKKMKKLFKITIRIFKTAS